MRMRLLPAIAVGLGAAVVQYALQPIPSWLYGYRVEPDDPVSMPIWASVPWAASALALGLAVTVAALTVKRWSTRHRFGVVIAGIGAYCLVNIAIAAPHLYGDWFNNYALLTLGFSWAVVIAGVVAWTATAVCARGSLGETPPSAQAATHPQEPSRDR